MPLVDDPYLFSDEVDGSSPWKPDSITQFFTRLRERVGLEHLTFHDLRKFMETYAQDLGFAPAAVAMRAGHDPSVMSKHYTGRIEEADRALANSGGGLDHTVQLTRATADAAASVVSRADRVVP